MVDELLVRERRLRVVVAPAQQRVARQPLEVPPVLLDVLAVVALRPGQPEHPLLQDRVARRSRARARGRARGGCRRSRPCRPRSSGTRASGRGRAGRSPRRRRPRSSPRGRCPRRARSGTGPTRTTGSPRRGRPRRGRSPRRAGRARRSSASLRARHRQSSGSRVGSRRRGARPRRRARRRARRGGRRRCARRLAPSAASSSCHGPPAEVVPRQRDVARRRLVAEVDDHELARVAPRQPQTDEALPRLVAVPAARSPSCHSPSRKTSSPSALQQPLVERLQRRGRPARRAGARGRPAAAPSGPRAGPRGRAARPVWLSVATAAARACSRREGRRRARLVVVLDEADEPLLVAEVGA